MSNTRKFIIVIFLIVFPAASVLAQDLSSYRGFRLEMTLPAAAKEAPKEAAKEIANHRILND